MKGWRASLRGAQLAWVQAVGVEVARRGRGGYRHRIAAWLCSPADDCFVGQVFQVVGG